MVDRKRMGGFKKPTDIKQWWMAPHCGPGTTDHNEICGFCGETYFDCALRNTESCRKDLRQECGGSGLWCTACGRFWAQDSCGESFNDELTACDGAKLSVKQDHVVCCCGRVLFKIDRGDDDEGEWNDDE